MAIVDIPSAYLHADMEGDVWMLLEDDLAILLTAVDPTIYQKYVTTKNGTPVIYVKINKTVYGCLKSALLFYKKLSGDLKEMGFIINPYDPCVAKKW